MMTFCMTLILYIIISLFVDMSLTKEILPNPDKDFSIDACEVTITKKTMSSGRTHVERSMECQCTVGKLAGWNRDRPACVPEYIMKLRSWCDMDPCYEYETCAVLPDKAGWQCNDHVTSRIVRVLPDMLKNAD